MIGVLTALASIALALPGPTPAQRFDGEVEPIDRPAAGANVRRRAIDLNPVENPYVTASGHVSPPAGERFARRSRLRRGMIHRGGPVVAAFAAIGWGWGGDWSGVWDYQHFSASGG